MKSVTLKWRKGVSLSHHHEKIRNIFPVGIPTVKKDEYYYLDTSRVTPEIMATCRSIAYGQILHDQSKVEKLLNAPLIVARESWINDVGLIDESDKEDQGQLNLF